jgi:hypothetical protein
LTGKYKSVIISLNIRSINPKFQGSLFVIDRNPDKNEIARRIDLYPVTAILGPRQCGKTTLARQFQAIDFYDLENPVDHARLENPILELREKKGLAVIDEIQRKPELFPAIRYMVDNNPDLKFLILGSASRDLIRQSSETLAGRISYFHLYGLRLHDVGLLNYSRLWMYGGFPRSYTAPDDRASYQWRYDYIRTYLERDIPLLGITIPSETLRRFWIMLSHFHGCILNYSELSRSFGLSDKTIKRYADILKGTFMIRLLEPYYANLGKRLVKSPKFYIRDSGIFHSLQNIETWNVLNTHPKLGASWEGFALDCVTRSIGKNDEEFSFYATHSQAELDLLWQHDGRNYGCEFKYGDSVKMTKSMKIAIDDLGLKKIWVVYPGNRKYPITENISALPLREIPVSWDYES